MTYQERIAKALDKKVVRWREKGELWVDIIGDLLPTELERALRETWRTALHNRPYNAQEHQRRCVEAGIEELEKP